MIKKLSRIFIQKFLMSVLFLYVQGSLSIYAQESVWMADNGDGTYKNPVLYADYSDPDVIMVGDDFYMTASSFNCIPGLPILHSKDMVNWNIVNYALKRLKPDHIYDLPQHGNGVYAPSIRYHNNLFYIFYGDPDYGIYALTTTDPLGNWSEPQLVKQGKGLIDPCPFWDNDGKMYVSHALAGSRAGLNSVIAIFPVCPQKLIATAETKIVYDGHNGQRTIEGTKFHKRNDFYYIFAPAGGVATGWQTVLRSKNIFGPYEARIVMKQGQTKINGPHQGAWVETNSGEHWFFHFQDKGTYGRVVHLQPMTWRNDWPIIGVDPDNDGCGEPVLSYKKPNISGNFKTVTTPESDEFNSNQLGLQWQWHANENPLWYFTDQNNGVLRLFSYFVGTENKNLWGVPNLLLQKFPAPEFIVTTKLSFYPDQRIVGEKTGLLIMGLDYAMLGMEKTTDGLLLSQIVCKDAEKGNSETTIASIKPLSNIVYLRTKVEAGAKCTFYYSYDNKQFEQLGVEFKARQGKWIGAKTGLFCSRPLKSGDGGWVDVDWFRIEK